MLLYRPEEHFLVCLELFRGQLERIPRLLHRLEDNFFIRLGLVGGQRERIPVLHYSLENYILICREPTGRVLKRFPVLLNRLEDHFLVRLELLGSVLERIPALLRRLDYHLLVRLELLRCVLELATVRFYASSIPSLFTLSSLLGGVLERTLVLLCRAPGINSFFAPLSEALIESGAPRNCITVLKNASLIAIILSLSLLWWDNYDRLRQITTLYL